MVLMSFNPKAQVTIQVQLPHAGMVQKDQLWNLILMNTKEDMINVYIRMSLKDLSSGQALMTASTSYFFLGKGVKIIRQNDVEPVIFNYNNPDFSRNYLPIGSYVICYQAYTINGEIEVTLGEECTRINIDPLSPPLLSYPANGSEINTPYPQFTWLPPSPLDMFSNLSYDLLVTEVLPGQSSSESIQYNTPIYSNNNLTRTNENYSSAYSKLDTGKVFAWQVVANNGASYAAKTEVWTFKIASIPATSNNTTGTYIVLGDNVSGTYDVDGGTLRIKYFSYAKEYKTNILFSDENDKIIKRFVKLIIPGENHFDIDVSHGFSKGKIYKVTLKDPQEKSHFLKFRIK